MSFTPFYTGFSTGQAIIPVGAKAYQINVETGAAFINGTLINSPVVIYGGGYDGRQLLAGAVSVGMSGNGRVVVSYEK